MTPASGRPGCSPPSATRRSTEGWQVHAGYCLDFGGGAPPYLPFSEILGRLTAAVPDVVASVAASHVALARLRPGRRLLDGTAGEESALDRGDLFEAVHALFEAVAAEAPLLLVIEDLHWADRSTRDMVSFLFGRPFEGDVAIVASYRTDDLHRRHPLRRQVAEWARMRGVERIVLRPLAPAAVRELVANLGGADLSEHEVAGIVARADGNAFFVEELVATGMPGANLPDDLAGVLLVRLDRLEEESREVVRAASAGGRQVSHSLLAAVSGRSGGELDDAVREAIDAHVLVTGAEGYSFRHALLGEAVYDDLLPGERVRLHARYVDALGTDGIRGTAAELARHARAAMDYETALTASIRAGADARAVGGPDEAAHHFEQALELMTDPRRPVPEGVDRSKVAVQAAEALTQGGRPGRAASLLREQLDALGPDATPQARARLLSARAQALVVIEPDEDPVEVSAAAVQLIGDESSGLRAQVLAVHAHVLAQAGRFDDAQAVGLDALALAERLDRTALVSEVATTLSFLKRSGPKELVREALVDAVERAQRTGAFAAELRGRFLLGRSYQDHGELEAAAEWFRSGWALAVPSGTPWAPYAFESRWQLAWVLSLTGEWDEALRLLDDTGQPGPSIPHALLQVLRQEILAARGAEPDLSGLRELWEEEGLIAIHDGALRVVSAARRGDARAVLAAYDEVVEVVTGIWHRWFGARVRLAACTLGGLAECAESLTRDERVALLPRVEELLDDGLTVQERLESYEVSRGFWGPEGQAWGARLVAEALRLRWLAGVDAPPYDELVRAWEEAITLVEDLGDVHRTAQARAVLAGILQAGGDTAAAREVAGLARATAEALGAAPLLDQLRKVGSSRAGRATSPATQELTPREREILALVAEGGTNGEIGRRLFISTKTVSVHVSNILAKLGAASRTEAVAVARRRGLLE